MATLGVHRIVEEQAVTQPTKLALVGDTASFTYRELNGRANTIARQLMAAGLTRGAKVIVNAAPCAELAPVLLAILKVGASYMWMDRFAGPWPRGVTILTNGARTTLPMDPATLVALCARPSPNLPVLTRGTDVACVLSQPDGQPGTLVPHATIAALCAHPAPAHALWAGRDPGALDLWAALMAGCTVIAGAEAAASAAA